MLGLFKKKKKEINTDEIKDFNNVLKVIEDFILFEEFDKAEKAISEILYKENESFQYYIETIPEKEKKDKLKIFKEKVKKIEKLKIRNQEKKLKYQSYIKQRKKKEEIDFIKKKTKELCGVGNFNEAIALINNLVEKNVNDVKILNLSNTLKKNITKEIEKYKIKKQREIKKDTLKEAQELIGEFKNSFIPEQNGQKKVPFFLRFKEKLNFYGSFKKRLKEKRLLDEVNLLLQSQNEKNELAAKAKLAQVHSGISREIYGEKINGYELYGKILGADKISGDTLGFHKNKNDYTFFIGDATGHGIKAGFIISQMTKKFSEIAGKLSLEEITFEINNALKQELKSGNFITSIFFQIHKHNHKIVDFIGMGHEPMFVFRKASGKVEKIIPGGLAAGIRIIKDVSGIKKKQLILEDGDILICYTDGIVEAKNEDGQMYSINRIAKKLEEFGRNQKLSLEDIYKKFIEDLKNFTSGKANYSDDVTLLLLKRDKNKEILDDKYMVESIIVKEGLDKKYKKKIIGKSLEEIQEEIKKIQKENALKNIIKSLEVLHKTGELMKLKQDCIRYIKEGYIHKKINFYLKKALDNETDFKIKQKNKKMQDKYNVLKELYKKGDYETVITECSSIISKDGNI